MELERALLGYPQLAEVATHAVRVDGDGDEQIKACLVLKPGQGLDREAYARFLMENVPHFAMPRFYEVPGA